MSTLSVDTIQGKTTSTKVDMPSGTMVQMTKVRDFQDSNL